MLFDALVVENGASIDTRLAGFTLFAGGANPVGGRCDFGGEVGVVATSDLIAC